MPVPKYNEMYAVLLKSLSDGQVHSVGEVRQYINDQLNLTDSDLAEMLPSGKQSLFYNRVGWARTYLNKAGLISSPGRGQLLITEEGKKALPDADAIDNAYLRKYPSFLAFEPKVPVTFGSKVIIVLLIELSELSVL